MLTISQLAAIAGVTVRAVRHYHARGLLPEPARDAAGYRRYNAQAVIDLIRIKTLANAGVPLAQISDLLAAEPERFAAAVDRIDQRLQDRIRELQGHRRRVRQLAAGDHLTLPTEVTDYLGRLRTAGVTERTVETERDSWILLVATYPPARITEWVSYKRQALDDTEYRDLYLAFDQAFTWQPDDPRLATLADAMLAYVNKDDPGRPRGAADGSAATPLDQTVTALVESHTAMSPAWYRLIELVDTKRAAARSD